MQSGAPPNHNDVVARVEELRGLDAKILVVRHATRPGLRHSSPLAPVNSGGS